MKLPDDVLIVEQLNYLLEYSDPGDIMHHMIVIASAPGERGPLGIREEKLETSVFAIAPVGPIDVPRFIAQQIARAGIEYAAKGKTPVFATLSQETYVVKDDTEYDELAVQLQAQGRLEEHPDVCEVTDVYGACRDGRRWQSRRWLTGPRAGETDDVVMLVGRVDQHEGRGVQVSPLLRRLVGIR